MAVLAVVLGACGGGGGNSGNGRLKVVAAENTWGSLAAQVGGDRVTVESLIANPSTDPHDYEPTPADGRAVASARYVVYNGAGYDPWAPKLLKANPDAKRVVLDVGALVGVDPGGNPHRWYAPDDVAKVIDQLTADYKRLAPADAAYFDQQHEALVNGLAEYRTTIADIKSRFAGTPVGASESMFAPLASALGLDLRTPDSFLRAVTQGSDPTAADKAAVDAQIKSKQIKVYVFNRQNATPDVKAQVDEAKTAGIPVVSITETLVPATATFQAWQVAQLHALQAALAQATGR